MAEQGMSGHPGDVKDTRGLITNEQEPHQQAPPYTPYAPQPATQRQQPMWYIDCTEQYNSSVPPPPYPGTLQGGVTPQKQVALQGYPAIPGTLQDGVSPQQQVAPQGYPAAPHSMAAPSQRNDVMVQGRSGEVVCRTRENYWRTRCCIIVVIVALVIVIIAIVLGFILSWLDDHD